MKKRKGFTLIELMITMAIVAVLATAGLQAYSGYLKKSRDTSRAQIASNLNTAVMAYAASNGGNPPADQNAFDTFLATSGEYFGGSGVTGTALVEDPVGGAEVCLDAAGTANQPCAFNYTAYNDGTYAISYGVEHESSTEKNFYKTTNSVAPLSADSNTTSTSQTPVPKYGVYVGSAKYIGQPATQVNQNSNYSADEDGVDETYTPPGATVAVPLVPVFRSIRVDVPTSSGGGSENGSGKAGASCFAHQDCGSGLYCQGPNSWPDENCFSGPCSYTLQSELSMSQCAVGNRNLGTGSVCGGDSQCSSGYCIGGICVQPQALNSSCTSHIQCLYRSLHFCINNVCTYYNN